MSADGRPRKVSFLTASLNSYRLGWFNELAGSIPEFTIWVARVERNRPWDAALDLPPFATRARSSHAGGQALEVLTFLQTVRPDHVVIPGWSEPFALAAVAWCRLHSIPYSLIHETWAPARGGVPSIVRRAVLSNARVAMPIGVRAARYAITQGVRPRLVHGNVCNVDEARRAAKGTSRTRPPLALYCGRLTYGKGIDRFLAMAAILGETNIQFSVVGAGPERDRVLSACERQRNLRFAGTVEGAAKFRMMASAAVLVVPSRVEPWGVVVHEALASGTPVVVTDAVGCHPDLVTNDVGKVVSNNADSVQELAAAVREITLHRADPRGKCQVAASRITYATAVRELLEALGLG